MRADAGTVTSPVSAAPFGSALIVPISYAYILLTGGPVLTRASQVAILNASSIATHRGATSPSPTAA